MKITLNRCYEVVFLSLEHGHYTANLWTNNPRRAIRDVRPIVAEKMSVAPERLIVRRVTLIKGS